MPHLPANAANQSSATRHLHQVSQTRCTRDQINRSLIGLFMTLITLHHHHQGLHRHRDVPDINNCKRVIVPLIAKYTKPIHFLPMISFFSLRSATCIKLILVNVKGLQASQSHNSLYLYYSTWTRSTSFLHQLLVPSTRLPMCMWGAAVPAGTLCRRLDRGEWRARDQRRHRELEPFFCRKEKHSYRLRCTKHVKQLEMENKFINR